MERAARVFHEFYFLKGFIHTNTVKWQLRNSELYYMWCVCSDVLVNGAETVYINCGKFCKLKVYM